MNKIYVYSCLLSALSIVEIQPVNIDGTVGKSVTFKCSSWNVWKNVEKDDKFFCNSLCSDVIVNAAFGKTERKDRIVITNHKDGLDVTFMNLQKSDSQKYYCGVKGLIFYDYIEVNLKVTDAESTSPSPTPTTLPVTTTEFITDMSTSYIIDFTETIPAPSIKRAETTAATSTQGAGNVPYLIICVIILITILVVMPTLIWKITRKQLRKEDTRESPADTDGVYQSLHPLKKDEDQIYSTLEPTNRSPRGPDGAQQSLHPLMKDEDQFYSTLQPTNMSPTGPDGTQQSLHPLMKDEDQFYSTLQPTSKNTVLESMSVDTRSGS